MARSSSGNQSAQSPSPTQRPGQAHRPRTSSARRVVRSGADPTYAIRARFAQRTSGTTITHIPLPRCMRTGMRGGMHSGDDPMHGSAARIARLRQGTPLTYSLRAAVPRTRTGSATGGRPGTARATSPTRRGRSRLRDRPLHRSRDQARRGALAQGVHRWRSAAGRPTARRRHRARFGIRLRRGVPRDRRTHPAPDPDPRHACRLPQGARRSPWLARPVRRPDPRPGPVGCAGWGAKWELE
jgi:hypothetical protein